MKRDLEVVGARDLGPLFTDNAHRMVGQDGGYSIPLREDEALWFFGDTLIGKRTPGESLWFPGGERIGPEDMSGKHGIEKMLTNTGLILRDSTGAGGCKNHEYLLDPNGGLLQLIPLLPDEDPDRHRIWCGHGCLLGEDVNLFFLKVTMLAEGPLAVNFEINGAGLAVGSPKDWKFSRLEHRGATLWWKEDDPKFGAAVYADDSSGYVYVYGVILRDGVQNCYVARAAPDRLSRFETYEYLIDDTPAWDRDLGKAIPILTGMPHEMSVSYNKHLGCYLAVHSLDLTGRIVGRTAENPWGPWSDPIDLWKVEPVYEKSPAYPPQIYAGKEHPELSGQDGSVLYLTYIEFEEYFPHLIEVSLR
jgi:hypothetical protein